MSTKDRTYHLTADLQARPHTFHSGTRLGGSVTTDLYRSASSSRVTHPRQTSLSFLRSRIHSLPLGWGGRGALQREQSSVEDGMAAASLPIVTEDRKCVASVYRAGARTRWDPSVAGRCVAPWR